MRAYFFVIAAVQVSGKSDKTIFELAIATGTRNIRRCKIMDDSA
jgi:hypothetical protein